MTDHTDIVERLRVAAIVLDHLPELPGFNGSVLMIDDVESARCAKAMFAAAAEITRLRAEDEVLRKALEDCIGDLEYLASTPDSAYARPDESTLNNARAAIAATTKEQKA